MTAGPFAAEEAHRVVDERLEGVGDLAGVAQVVVEDQRHQRHGRGAVAVEDALALVGEDVDAAGLVVLERGEQRVPPGVGEVLRLVDDDRVESVAGLELRCEIGHLEREVVLPELHGLVGAQRLRRGLRVRPTARRGRGTRRRRPGCWRRGQVAVMRSR